MTIIAASVIGLLAAFVRGASGFGFALVATPLLAMIYAPAVVAPAVFLLDLLLSLTLIRSGVFRDMRWGEAIGISVLGLLGSAVGAAFVSGASSLQAEIGLDLAMLASAIAALLNVHVRSLDHPVIGALVSFVTGVVIGAFAVGGPLLLAWLLAVRRSPSDVRGTLTLMFGAADIAGVVSRIAFGTFSMDSVVLVLVLAPTVILGLLLGGRVFDRVEAEVWRKWIAGMLAVVALLGLGRAGMALR